MFSLKLPLIVQIPFLFAVLLSVPDFSFCAFPFYVYYLYLQQFYSCTKDRIWSELLLYLI